MLELEPAVTHDRAMSSGAAEMLLEAGATRLELGPMTPELIRAARGYLDWSANELAVRAEVSFSTVRRAEAAGERHLRDGSLGAIRRAFEHAGIRFIQDADGRLGLIAR